MTAMWLAAPPIGVTVLVWHYIATVPAIWTGRRWVDETGRQLAGDVWYWRAK